MAEQATERTTIAAPPDVVYATALDIDRRYNGADLCAAGPLWLGAAMRPPARVGRSVRIGISREIERKLRFFERDNPYVSGPRRLHA